ncbi:MAG: uroporphyrinogen decarboxylase family protein [Kiritimatiellia bacterium]|jgi:uroporphyrinogen decarboxylase
MNTKQWLAGIIAAEKRKAMPILSFPCTQLQGITVRELVSNSDLQAGGMAMIAERCPTAASVSMMDLSVEAECFGAQICFSDDEVPAVIGAVVSTPEEANALVVPAVGTGRTGAYLEAIAKAKATITDRPLFAGVIGPFSLAGRLMDMTGIMVNCYDAPEMVHTVLEKTTSFLISYISAYKRIGANGVIMAEPAAGLLSPALCIEFSSPYIKQIVAAVQDENFIVIYHNCGPAIAKLTKEILQTGAAAYHFGNAIEMKKILELMPSDTLVLGNVDPVSIFRNGTPESMRDATFQLLSACSPHKNFLISSGCDIPPLSPWANIDAFFEAVNDFYQTTLK